MPEQDYFDEQERMHMVVQVETIQLTDGLGFGDGSISVTDRTDEDHEHHIEPEVLQLVDDAVRDDEILVAVDEDNDGLVIEDDGCGDGRGVDAEEGSIFKKIGDHVEHMKRSLNRYKAFGGGATMSTASLIGRGKAKGQTLSGAFKEGIHKLKSNRISFGAHIDTHAHGENCGCGAIDKSPVILQNIVKYRDRITEAAGLLAPDTTGLEGVLDNMGEYADEIKDQPFAGQDVMDDIIDQGKVVKRLEGPHLEVAIVINTVEGYTVNQDYVRRITQGRAQVFAVDVPRLTQLAEKLHPNDTVEQRQSFLSMLVYTLGTAATLTKGDLPVYIVSGATATAEVA